jgi:elongator complex protein 1
MIREEDVSQTLYKDTLKISKNESAVVAQPDTPAVTSVPKTSKVSKVNAICDSFLAILQNRMDTNLQNLVTAHVCKSPPDLEAGLELVAGLRGMSTSIICRGMKLTTSIVKSPEQADDAIEHMCFLTDAYRLYSHALGIYDLELTLLVAQQAQMVSHKMELNTESYLIIPKRTPENISPSFESCSNCPRLDGNSKSTTTFLDLRRP